MVVRIFGELTDILHVVTANVHVKENHVAVDVLLLQQMFKVLAHGHNRFRKTWLFVPRVDSEVEHGNARITEAVSHFWPQQAAVGSDVNPEALLGCVIDNLVRELRTQQRLSSHQGKYAAAVVVKPIDRSPGHILSHALYFVVEGPTIPAVEIALVLQKKVGG